jgi:outer membrane protein TolC
MRLILSSVVVALCAVSVSARELTLAEALTAAEAHEPALKAARARELAAREGVGEAQSAYAPTVSADAVDSWGFPGSSGALGLGGLVASPYRSGAAAGLVARDTLYDFGRTGAAVDAARRNEDLRHDETALTRQSADIGVLRAFDACARFRTGREVWDQIHTETELVAKEIARYVATGQRSVVDRFLADAQVEEARTNRNYYKSRMGSTLQRLALLTGLPEDDLQCTPLPEAGHEPVPASAGGVDPEIERARTEVELAKVRLTGVKDDFLPKLFGIASVGTMERARLVNKEDWSGGLGVSVPLFDGLGSVRRYSRVKAELEARHQDLDAAQLHEAVVNARYDEVIDASRARIEHLQRELALAQEGFRVAKDRYFKYQGTLADMRDALRNLGRIEIEMVETRADLIEAVEEKALVNGGRP